MSSPNGQKECLMIKISHVEREEKESGREDLRELQKMGLSRKVAKRVLEEAGDELAIPTISWLQACLETMHMDSTLNPYRSLNKSRHLVDSVLGNALSDLGHLGFDGIIVYLDKCKLPPAPAHTTDELRKVLHATYQAVYSISVPSLN